MEEEDLQNFPPISCFLFVKVWNLLAEGLTLRTQLGTVLEYLIAESKEKVSLSSQRGLCSTRKNFAWRVFRSSANMAVISFLHRFGRLGTVGRKSKI